MDWRIALFLCFVCIAMFVYGLLLGRHHGREDFANELVSKWFAWQSKTGNEDVASKRLKVWIFWYAMPGRRARKDPEPYVYEDEDDTKFN